jgi:uncharacterized protein YkwD
MPVKAYMLVVAVLLSALPPAARADLHDAVNWARVQGCARSIRIPLRDSPKLRRAAQQMATGMSLHAALSSAGYLAAQSSAVHLSGAVSDAQVSRILSANDCAALTDPHVVEMGAQRRGRDLWIVFAAPVALPSTRDAALIQRQILDLVNRSRESGRRCGSKPYPAVPPLTLNTVLTDAALAHSREMAAYDEFDHRGHDGSSPAARVARAGYGKYLIVGENIAAGAMTPAEVTQGWLDSPPHCENIMDSRFSQIGIGFAVNTASPELVYWTQEFAAPRRDHIAGRTASNP